MSDLRVSPVDVSTLQERVYLELRSALFRGRFAPGETLSIRTLARALGTSEMPVREALQRLTAEKVLQQVPGRSVQVTPTTRERHDELTRIRIVVEGLATKRAAPHADAMLILQLKKFTFEMGEAASAKDWLRALQSNHEFHFAIYRAAKSAQLFEIIESLWLRTGPFLAAAYRGPQKPEEMFLRGMQVHERVVAALDGRDGKAAMQGVMLDIKSVNSWYRRYCDFAVAS